VPAGRFTRLLQPGAMVKADGLTFTVGGSVANTGLALHQLGLPVRLIGKVGEDTAGRLVSEFLAGHDPQLAEDLVLDPSVPTGFSIILNPPGFDRTFLHAPGANNTFYASDLPRAKLTQADLLHFGYPSLMRSIYRGGGGELVSILQRARRAGLTTSLDFSLPDLSTPAAKVDWPDLLANGLPYVDLFLPSVQDLLFLLDRETFDALSADPTIPLQDAITPKMLESLAAIVLDYGVKVLMVKLGHRGVYLRTAEGAAWGKGGRALDQVASTWHDRALWAPAFRVEVAGTTGAGDAANAGFLVGLLRGASPETALQTAAGAGAACVENAGARRGIPNWKAITTRIEQGWSTLPLDPSGPGWRKDKTNDIWQKD
jgi:sugar/nucleoside kinase (ribokinase family)